MNMEHYLIFKSHYFQQEPVKEETNQQRRGIHSVPPLQLQLCACSSVGWGPTCSGEGRSVRTTPKTQHRCSLPWHTCMTIQNKNQPKKNHTQLQSDKNQWWISKDECLQINKKIFTNSNQPRGKLVVHGRKPTWRPCTFWLSLGLFNRLLNSKRFDS